MTTSNSPLETLCLYKIIYTNIFVRCVVFVFLFGFVFLPLAPAFANTEIPLEVEVSQDNEETAVFPEEIGVAEEVAIEEDIVVEGIPETVLNNELVTEETLTLEGAENSSPEEQSQSINIDEEDSSSTTTTEAAVVEEQIVRSEANNDLNFYQFSKTSCVPVKGGSFYCSKVVNEDSKDIKGEKLFSAPDEDGDLEIFARTEDGLQQISFNESDDAAPYFDQVSNTIVWHRLVNDRYQIISYNVATGDETELTRDVVNNMEPHRFGKYTTWQRWVNDNWEIVLFDGKRTEQITTSAYPDIAPQIRGEYVLWKTIKPEGQVVSVYDLVSKTTIEISGEDSNSILSNPRMVLVYDSIADNGEKVTKGYDPITGELVRINEENPQAPLDIPKTDETGETRALIQGKNQNGKDQSLSEEDNQNGDTVIDEHTLVLPSIQATTTVINTEEETANTLDISTVPEPQIEVISEDDLVIPLYTATSTAE